MPAVSSSTDITLMLQKGIAAARTGRAREARSLLQQVVQADPDNEMAWLWLSGLMMTNQQKRDCLEQVLRTNPENVYAKAGLARLQNTVCAQDRPLGLCSSTPALQGGSNSSMPSGGEPFSGTLSK